MKTTLFTLFLCTFFTGLFAQNRYFVGTGEYQNFIIDNSNGKLYALGNNSSTQGLGANLGIFGMAIQTSLASSGIRATYIASALHNGMAVDATGNLYFAGANDGGQIGNGTIGGTSYSF